MRKNSENGLTNNHTTNEKTGNNQLSPAVTRVFSFQRTYSEAKSFS